MFKYSFDHDGGRYNFNLSFKPPELQLGGTPNFDLQRAFCSTDVYQLGDVTIPAKGFLLSGWLAICSSSTELPETDAENLRVALQTATKLYSTDHADANEAYVDCSGASELVITPINPYGLQVSTIFWVLRNKWRLSSDDSETII